MNRQFDCVLLLFLIGFSVTFRATLQSGNHPSNTDESQYLAEVAHQAHSHLAWAAALQAGANRPPHFFLFVLLQRVFGNYCWKAADITHSVIIGITAWMIGLASLQLQPISWLTRGCIGFVFIIHSGFFNEGITNNSEHLANFFCIGFLCCWLRGDHSQRRLTRCGALLLLGLAVSVKKQLFPMVLCVPVLWYLSPRIDATIRSFTLEMLGSATCFLLPHLIFTLSFNQVIAGADTVSLTYAFTSPHEPFGFIATFASKLRDDPLALPASVVAGTVTLLHLLKPVLRHQHKFDWPLGVASAYFAGSLASVLPGLRLWDHYYMLTTPAAVLVVIASIRLGLANHIITKTGVAIGSVLWSCLFVPQGIMAFDITEDAELTSTAQWIRSHCAPNDTIFVWGWQPELYALSDRIPASRFATTNYVVNDIQTESTLPPINTNNLDYLLQDLFQTEPKWFVVTKHNFYTTKQDRYQLSNIPPLQEYLEHHFEPEPKLRTARFDVYRKKSDTK